jgi:hypothetical protein
MRENGDPLSYAAFHIMALFAGDAHNAPASFLTKGKSRHD